MVSVVSKLAPLNSSTLLMVPSVSVAVAVTMIVAGAVPLLGLAVTLMVGAVLLITVIATGALLVLWLLLSVTLAVRL